LNKQSRTA